MSHTAIGIFRERAQAEAAVHALMDSGFRRDKMDIAFPDPNGNDNRGDTTDENSSLDSKIGRFFLDAFKGDANQALKYAAVGQRGVVIALQADFYADAQKAAAIMDQCGAVNVEQEGRVVEDSMTRSDRTFQRKEDVAREKHALESAADAAAADRAPTVSGEERISTDEYTIHSRVVERPAADDQRIRDEQTWIERKQVDDVQDDETKQSAT
jgi:hypothetical protein